MSRGFWSTMLAGGWSGVGAGSGAFGEAAIDLVWQPGGRNSAAIANSATALAAKIEAALQMGAVRVNVHFDNTFQSDFVFDAAFGHLKRVYFYTNVALNGASQGQTSIEIADGASCLSLPRYFGLVADATITKTDGPFCTVGANEFGLMEFALGGGMHCEAGADALVEVENDGFLIFFGYGRIGESYGGGDPAVVRALGDDAGVHLILRDGGVAGLNAIGDGGFSPDLSISATVGCTITQQAHAVSASARWDSDAALGMHRSIDSTPLDSSSAQFPGSVSAYYAATAARTHTLLNPSLWKGTEYTVINSNGSAAAVTVVKHDASAFADGLTSYVVPPGASITFLAESNQVLVRHWSPNLPQGYLYGLEVTGNNGLQTISIAAGSCRDSTNTVDMVSGGTGTITITSVGANGRDAGSATAGMWAVYLIMKADGTIAYIASTNFSSPTLPATYVYYRRLGTIRYTGSVVLGSIQRGYGPIRETIYTVSVFQSGNIGASGSFDWSGHIPSTAHAVKLSIDAGNFSGASYGHTYTFNNAPNWGFWIQIDENAWPGNRMAANDVALVPGGTRVISISRNSGSGTLYTSQSVQSFTEAV